MAYAPMIHIVGVTGAVQQAPNGVGANNSLVNGVIQVEVLAFHGDGGSLTVTLDDGVNPPVQDTVTLLAQSSYAGGAELAGDWMYVVELDPTGLNDGPLTLTATFTAGAESASEVWTLHNNSAATYTLDDIWVKPYMSATMGVETGTLVAGEKLTFSPSGAVGWFIQKSAGSLYWGIGSSTDPASGDTATGGTSGATVAIAATPTGLWSGTPAANDVNNPYRSVKQANDAQGTKTVGHNIKLLGITGVVCYYAEPLRYWFNLTNQTCIGHKFVELDDAFVRGDVIHRESADSNADFVASNEPWIGLRDLVIMPSVHATGTALELVKPHFAASRKGDGVVLDNVLVDASESPGEWSLRVDTLFPDDRGSKTFVFGCTGRNCQGGWNRWHVVRDTVAENILQDIWASGNKCDTRHHCTDTYGDGTHSDALAFNYTQYATSNAADGGLNYICHNCRGLRNRSQWLFLNNEGLWTQPPGRIAIVNLQFSDTTHLAWTAGMVLDIGESTYHGGTRWSCILGHTSDASTEPGVGASWATYWEEEFGFGGTIWDGMWGLVALHNVIFGRTKFGTDRTSFADLAVKGNVFQQMTEDASASGSYAGSVVFTDNHYYVSGDVNTISPGTGTSVGAGGNVRSGYDDIAADMAVLFVDFAASDLEPMPSGELAGLGTVYRARDFEGAEVLTANSARGSLVTPTVVTPEVTVYAHSQYDGSNGAADGTITKPFTDPADIVAAMADPDIELVIGGPFRESMTFTGDNPRIRAWTLDELESVPGATDRIATIRGDQTASSWSAHGTYTNAYIAATNAPASKPRGVVIDWDTRVWADGRHNAHLEEAASAALCNSTPCTWFWNTTELLVNPPAGVVLNDHVVGWCQTGSGIIAEGDNGTIEYVDFALWIDTDPGNGYGFKGSAVEGWTASYLDFNSCGYHHGGFAVGKCRNNWMRHCSAVSGSFTCDSYFVVYSSSGDLDDSGGIGCVARISPLLKYTAVEGAETYADYIKGPSSVAPDQTGFGSHTGGSQVIANGGVLWQNCATVLLSAANAGYKRTAFSNGQFGATPADKDDASTYAVRFVDCSFQCDWVSLGQGTYADVFASSFAFVRTYIDTRTCILSSVGAGATPNGIYPNRVWVLMDSCVVVSSTPSTNGIVRLRGASTDKDCMRARNCSFFAHGVTGSVFHRMDAENQCIAVHCVFASDHSITLFGSNTGVTASSYQFSKCVYGDTITAYGRGAAYDSQAEWTAAVDPNGLYGVDFDGQFLNTVTLQPSRISALATTKDLTANPDAPAGINNVPYQGNAGAWQIGPSAQIAPTLHAAGIGGGHD